MASSAGTCHRADRVHMQETDGASDRQTGVEKGPSLGVQLEKGRGRD